MNIIELFENSEIYKQDLREFTFDDNLKIKKQFDIERSGNVNVPPDLGNNLILAMSDFPNQLLFICHNRVLYNLFSKKNYSRNRFSSDYTAFSSAEDVKQFIDKFLSNELDLILDNSMTQNRFDNIDDLFVVKEYLPDASLDKLSKKVSDKIDFATATISGNMQLGAELQSVDYIKYRSFYVLVSHFRSKENDEKIRLLYNKVYNLHSNSLIRLELYNPMVSALVNYKAINTDMNNLFQKNKDRLDEENEKSYDTGRSSGFSGGWSTVLLIIVILRLIMFMIRLGRA